ncbi:MAG: DUF3043 domain-containing protein [Carbonactinosporaceae bacterium]
MFRRRVQDPPEAAQESAPPEGGTRPEGKGRPTPRRREAEQHRRSRLKAPASRREAGRASRQRAREERLRSRQALVKGDERHFPPRDSGPVRRLARDYVDARRCAGEVFLPGAIVVFVLGLFPNVMLKNASLLIWLGMIAIIIVDSTLVVRGVRRGASQRFPDESQRGLTAYTLMRTLQIRRLRLPPPRVKPGERF